MSKRLFKIIEIIGILVIIWVCIKVFPYFRDAFLVVFKVFLPFLIGFSFAFCLEPLVKYTEKKRISRKISIGIISVLLVLFAYLFCRYLVPGLIRQLNSFLDMLPSYIDNFEDILDKIKGKFDGLPVNFDNNIDIIENRISEFISGILDHSGDYLQRGFSIIFNIVITPIIAIYFINDYPKIESNLKKFLLDKKKEKIVNIMSEIKNVIRQYIKGVFLVMIILSLVTWGCLLIIGVEYALIFAIIIGITDIIPYVGPYIGGGIVVLFVLVSSPTKVLYVLIVIVILQFLESNFLVPKIQSKTLHTHPLLVLLSVAIFGELFGIFGMILALPIVKIIEILIKSKNY